MKKLLLFLKATIIGGIWFLIPLIVLAIILSKAHQITTKIVTPVADLIPIHSIIGMAVPKVLAIVAIVLFCFLAGILARAKHAKKVIDWLEATLLSNLPGYDFMKSMGANLIGLEQGGKQEVVLARIEDALQIGFIRETLENGLYAVFVPDAPNPWSGSVYFMTEDRFKRLKISSKEALKCLRRLGLGATELLKGENI